LTGGGNARAAGRRAGDCRTIAIARGGAAGAFRSDLFYRINVFPWRCRPCARARKNPTAGGVLLDRYARKRAEIQGINKKTLELLQATLAGNIPRAAECDERSELSVNGDLRVDASWLAQESVSEEPARQALEGAGDAGEGDD